jgi:hypothetical protein
MAESVSSALSPGPSIFIDLELFIVSFHTKGTLPSSRLRRLVFKIRNRSREYVRWHQFV